MSNEEDDDKAIAETEEGESSKSFLKKSSSKALSHSSSKSNDDLVPGIKKKKSSKKGKGGGKKASEDDDGDEKPKALVKSKSKRGNKSCLSRYKVPLLVLLFGTVAALIITLCALLINNDNTSSSLSTSSRTVEYVEDLQYLSIGASRALGVSDWYSSYPYLLSPEHEKVTHIADGVSGPRYPSVCIQSLVQEAVEMKAMEGNYEEDMVDYYQAGGYEEEEEEALNKYDAIQTQDIEEDGEYDVIVLNYYIRSLDGLYELTQRLRQRYPDAIIVLLKLWKPVHIGWYNPNTGARVGSLKDWSLRRGVQFGTVEFFEQLQMHPNLDLRWQGFAQRDEVIERIIQDFNAHLYTLPYHPRDPVGSILEYGEYFNTDFTSLSQEGHRIISLGILQTVYQEFQSYPTHPRIGTWGDGDACSSWFMTGDCPLEHSPNLIMEEFQGVNVMEYALSTGIERPTDSGWIIVENSFDGPRSLILSYMVDGPPPSMYPKTAVRIVPIKNGGNNGNGEEEEEVIAKKTLDPVVIDARDEDRKVHTVQTTLIGMIPPGRSKIVWRPLEEKERPFRLTAVEVVGGAVEIGGILGPAADYSNLDQY